MNKELMFSSATPEWSTPQAFFDTLNEEFHFTLDPCCTDENAKCKNHFTKKEDGLLQDWETNAVFCNPPYGREVKEWVRKCHLSAALGSIVVALLPARTDTSWFHDYIYNIAEIRFIRGRLKFGGCKNSAPFPSMVVIWR